jgi:hypothetical protein
VREGEGMEGRRTLARGARLLALLAVPLAIGCVVPPAGDPVDPLPTDLEAASLTHDGSSRYHGVATAGGLDLTGAADVGSNARTIIWPRYSPVTADQLACVTWTSQSDPVDQEGVALRIRPSGATVRAITVTKNVWQGAEYLANVHVWDTHAAPETITMIGSVDLSAALGAAWVAPAPLPWRMCARATGSTVEVMMWPLANGEPAWGDPRYSGTVGLPPGWDAPGLTGWYAGHLAPGHRITYTDLVPAYPGLIAAPVTP